VFSGPLTGNVITGELQVDYSLGVGVKTDDQIFALGQSDYIPISVTVGGKKARNITDYVALKHPAFSVSSNKGNDFEYIQAGKRIYFNQAISSEVKVDYRWITDYVRIKGKLRCNTAINPDITPKVNEIRILINNMVI
jgi:hypothetical protein